MLDVALMSAGQRRWASAQFLAQFEMDGLAVA